MLFIDRLIGEIIKKDNPTVMGLDPKWEQIPSFIKRMATDKYGISLKAAAWAMWMFNKILIDCVCDVIPAVKPQSAYYEMYGTEGIGVFKKTIDYARKQGMLVIADGKRNDIGSTAEAYSNAYLGRVKVCGSHRKVFDADALTVNPYLGSDGIKPFISDCIKYEKGIFVLIKTSNPSSVQIQDLIIDGGDIVYQMVADMVEGLGDGLIGKYGYSSIGAVVGATYPDQAKGLRESLKSTFFLVPGYGAQGGTAEDVVVNFDENGRGAIINASRSLMCAYSSDRWKKTYSEKEFGLAARAEALRMKDDIKAALQIKSK